MDGLYTNTEMVDQIIIKLDGALKALIGGERLAFAAGYVEIMQMLASLKKGIDTDNRMHAQQIKMLEEQLAAANTITPTGDGDEVVGGERIVFSAGLHGEMDPAKAGTYTIPIDPEGRLNGGDNNADD